MSTIEEHELLTEEEGDGKQRLKGIKRGENVALQDKLLLFFSMFERAEEEGEQEDMLEQLRAYTEQNPEVLVWVLDNASKPGRTGEGELEKKALAAMSKWNEAVCIGIVNELHLQQGSKVLEIGFGHGKSLIMCAKRLEELGGGSIVGTDVSDMAVKETKAALEALALQKVDCKIVNYNVQELPFSEGSFHLIYHANSWYYWPELMPGCKECFRVLAPGGVMVVGSKPNTVNSTFGEAMKAAKGEGEGGGRIYNTELSELERCLKQVGFVDVKSSEDKGGKNMNPLLGYTLTSCTKPSSTT